jgi:hypothetical protein
MVSYGRTQAKEERKKIGRRKEKVRHNLFRVCGLSADASPTEPVSREVGDS